MVHHLVALDLTFSSTLLFEQFSVCQLFGSHRSLLVRHTGPLIVFWVIWGVVYLEYFLIFFPKQLHSALILPYISSFEFCNFFNFSPWSISISSLSALPCVFLGQLSDFLTSDYINVFPFVFVSSLKSKVVTKPLVCKVFSINIDFFRDVCLLKDFFHNSSK